MTSCMLSTYQVIGLSLITQPSSSFWPSIMLIG